MINKQHFLPYQVRYLKDKSRIKIVEKSRRVGFTYVQSYEDVDDCVMKRVPQVWFSSADESAAKEYIEYCALWAKVFNLAVSSIDEEYVDEKKDITAYVIRFKNGTKITGLSSNPKKFRSKGGKVVLDEYAWHEDDKALWDAARPAITWGFPLRILSTHNGKSCKYYHFLEDVKSEKLNWSLHSVPIQKAVAEGLADKILGRKLTDEEREEWIEEERKNCGDHETWLQEYCCIPVDGQSAFLPYDLIRTCEVPAIEILKPIEEIKGDLFIGYDVARKKDLSVCWALERTDRFLITRFFDVMKKTKFSVQREYLEHVFKHRSVMRGCLDASGLGMQLAEEIQETFGKYRVEDITFTARIKEEMAYGIKSKMEDRELLIPSDFDVREDLHSIKKITTSSGHIRFDVKDSKTNGHGDRFWAMALAKHAVSNDTGPIKISSGKRSRRRKITDGY